MRIEGTEASGVTFTRTQDTKPNTSTNTGINTNTNDNKSSTSQKINTILNNANISQITDYEKKELPVSDKVVIDAIQKANKAIMGANTRFEFSIHEKTKEIVVKVINSDTNEVIREIPNEKILDMVAKMWEMAGLIVDERR